MTNHVYKHRKGPAFESFLGKFVLEVEDGINGLALIFIHGSQNYTAKINRLPIMGKFLTHVNSQGETIYINTEFIVRYEMRGRQKQIIIHLSDGSVFCMDYTLVEYTEILKGMGHQYFEYLNLSSLPESGVAT